MVPFKTPEDEAAFNRMISVLAPEDRDMMVEIYNRYDPVTGRILASDSDMHHRIVGKIVDAYLGMEEV